MLVSVIIPVYNVAPYLREALDSVIHQTYINLEIIIIDDGSTDGSGDICDEYAKHDNRIVLFHQENKGLSAARNVGLNNLTGDVIAFLDSDDAYHPDFINSMLSALIRDETDISVCRYTCHKTSGNITNSESENLYPIMVAGVYNRNSALQALVEGQLNISTWNKLYRRKLWKEIRFPDGHVFEEQKTILEVFYLCETISVLDMPLYKYRKRPGSISDTITPANIRDLVLAYSYVCGFVLGHLNEVFTLKHANKAIRSHIKIMVALYSKCCRKAGNDWVGLREEIRKQTIEIIQNNKVGDRYSKACGWLLRYCPGILKTAYPLYHSIRMFIWNLFKK